jgi:DNA-binding NarL/FixJ family response regulator
LRLVATRGGPAPPAVTALVVSPVEEHCFRLLVIFQRLGWKLLRAEAGSLTSAIRLLQTEAISVVLCEPDLRVGDWRDLRSVLNRLPAPPALLVLSPPTSESLRAEVARAGGQTVQLGPLEEAELARTVQEAASQWTRDHARPRPVR